MVRRASGRQIAAAAMMVQPVNIRETSVGGVTAKAFRKGRWAATAMTVSAGLRKIALAIAKIPITRSPVPDGVRHTLDVLKVCDLVQQMANAAVCAICWFNTLPQFEMSPIAWL